MERKYSASLMALSRENISYKWPAWRGININGENENGSWRLSVLAAKYQPSACGRRN